MVKKARLRGGAFQPWTGAVSLFLVVGEMIIKKVQGFIVPLPVRTCISAA